MSAPNQFLCILTKTGATGQEQLTFDCKPLDMAPMTSASMPSDSMAPMAPMAPMPSDSMSQPSVPMSGTMPLAPSTGANQPIMYGAYRRY